MSEALIPIFPLGIVPLPGEPVPLHIFEPRYKQMVSDCAPRPGSNGYLPIGINFSKEHHLHEVGCTVVIHQILHKYADGQLDLMTLGTQRYRLLKMHEDQPYLKAEVVLLNDHDPAERPEPTLKATVLAGFAEFLKLIGSDSAVEAPEQGLSFHLASLLSLEIEARLALIELQSENERLKKLESYLAELLPRLQKAHEFKRRVRSNGHFKPKS